MARGSRATGGTTKVTGGTTTATGGTTTGGTTTGRGRKRQQHHHHQRTSRSTIVRTFTSPDTWTYLNLLQYLKYHFFRDLHSEMPYYVLKTHGVWYEFRYQRVPARPSCLARPRPYLYPTTPTANLPSLTRPPPPTKPAITSHHPSWLVVPS